MSSRAGALIDEAINACPQARLIVFDYDMVGPSGTRRLAAVGETRLIHPPEAMARAALHCNWFGAPLGHVVRRDALSNGYEFGSLPWVADMWFCIEIAMRLPVLAVDVPIGTFNMAQRAYHTRYAHSLEASLEEGLARSRAADHYLAITGDQSGYRQLRQVIEQSTIAAINDRAFVRNASEATQVRTAA